MGIHKDGTDFTPSCASCFGRKKEREWGPAGALGKFRCQTCMVVVGGVDEPHLPAGREAGFVSHPRGYLWGRGSERQTQGTSARQGLRQQTTLKPKVVERCWELSFLLSNFRPSSEFASWRLLSLSPLIPLAINLRPAFDHLSGSIAILTPAS